MVYRNRFAPDADASNGPTLSQMQSLLGTKSITANANGFTVASPDENYTRNFQQAFVHKGCSPSDVFSELKANEYGEINISSNYLTRPNAAFHTRSSDKSYNMSVIDALTNNPGGFPRNANDSTAPAVQAQDQQREAPQQSAPAPRQAQPQVRPPTPTTGNQGPLATMRKALNTSQVSQDGKGGYFVETTEGRPGDAYVRNFQLGLINKGVGTGDAAQVRRDPNTGAIHLTEEFLSRKGGHSIDRFGRPSTEPNMAIGDALVNNPGVFPPNPLDAPSTRAPQQNTQPLQKDIREPSTRIKPATPGSWM